MPPHDSPVFTVGDLGRRFGVAPWKVRRLFELGRLAPAKRCGAYRVVTEAELPAIEQALREAGYLPSQEPARAG